MSWSNGWKFDVSNVSHRRSFKQFMEYIRANLGVGGVLMQDARRLPEQGDNPGFQDLELSNGDHTVTFRLRTDNVFVLAFRNAAGVWFRFSEEQPIHGLVSQEISGLTINYGRGGMGNLLNTKLSTTAVHEAVAALANYTGGDIQLQVRISLRTLIVTFIESSRLTMVGDTVAQAMAGTDQLLNVRLDNLIHNWSSLSSALLLAANPRVNDPPPPTSIFQQFWEMLGIGGTVAAAEALGLILMSTRKGAGPGRMLLAIANAAAAGSDAGAYGITLLEVFSVVIINIDGENPGDLYGTVRVKDSFGTVDLFNREQSDIQSVGPGGKADLVWPARGISADDDLVIDINLMDLDRLSPDDEVSRGEVVWIPRNALSSESDVATKAKVPGKYGSVEVSYAVVTNAVVAKMEVLLIDGDGESKPDVYGTITASTMMMGPAANPLDYDLFRRERSNQISVPKNTNIPLLRKVIFFFLRGLRKVITAVWGTPLIVNVDLWDKDSFPDPSPDDQIAKGSVSFQFQPQVGYSEAKQIIGRSGKVEVHVTWSLSHEEM